MKMTNQMNNKYSFAIFILSYNRCDLLFSDTLKLLKEYNYSSDWFVVVDDNDPQLEIYKEKISNKHLIIFNKKEIIKDFDIMDNFNIFNVAVYSRNFINKIAKKMNYDYYLVLDDDYNTLAYKKDDGNVLRERKAPKDINIIIKYMIDFLKSSNIDCVCLAQAGDYIGGQASGMILKGYSRKAMNSFLFKKDTDITFKGTINEDVNMYVYYGSIGKVFITYGRLFFRQRQTQLISGGNTEYYLEKGTYVKTFYTKIIMPSCTDIYPMGQNHLRIHHNIRWNNCVPKIIDGRWKK